MKISQKDARLLILLACVLLLGASYFFGYKKYSDKTDAINKETQVLKKEYETLESSNIHREEYVQKIKDNEEKIKTIIAKFPATVQNQDEIYLSSIIEQTSGAWINSFNFSEPSVVYTPQSLTEGKTEVNSDGAKTTDEATPNQSVTPNSAAPNTVSPQQATPQPVVPDNTSASSKGNTGGVLDSVKKMFQGDVPVVEKLNFTGCKNITALSFKSDYNQMKKMVELIIKYTSCKSINRVNLAVDKSTGLLTGNLEYSSYSISGAEATYKPLEVPSKPLGIKNIFGEIVSNNKNDKDIKDQNH